MDNFIYITRNVSDEKKSHLGWYFYRLETADGLYPESPAEIDMLKLITTARTVEMQPVGNYRVYRGQFDQPYLPVNKVIEDSDVVGHNRHQLIKQSDVWNEYEGNIGTTGAGIESMLKYNYFNGESN